MNYSSNKDIWVALLDAQKERLRRGMGVFPYPALLAVGLANLFLGHLLFDLNPRVHAQSDVFTFDAEPVRDGGIWLSVKVAEDRLVVDTSDRRRFLVDFDDLDGNANRDLVSYLKDHSSSATIDAALQSQINDIQSTATIAADQRLKFIHIRPILNALAEAGIARYGFETRLSLADGHSGHRGVH